MACTTIHYVESLTASCCYPETCLSLGLLLFDVGAEFDRVGRALGLGGVQGLRAVRVEELGDAEGACGRPDADRAARCVLGVGAAEDAAVRARRVGVRVAAERGED